MNKVHQVELSFRYKERRAKLYVCEDCGITTENPEEHLEHLQKFHPNSPALKRSYDRRIIKINNNGATGKKENSNSNMDSNLNSSNPSPVKKEMSGNEEEELNYSCGEVVGDEGDFVEEEAVVEEEVPVPRKKSRKSAKESVRVYQEEDEQQEELEFMNSNFDSFNNSSASLHSSEFNGNEDENNNEFGDDRLE